MHGTIMPPKLQIKTLLSTINNKDESPSTLFFTIFNNHWANFVSLWSLLQYFKIASDVLIQINTKWGFPKFRNWF